MSNFKYFRFVLTIDNVNKFQDNFKIMLRYLAFLILSFVFKKLLLKSIQ